MLTLQKMVTGTKVDNAMAGAIFPINNNRAYLQLEDVHATTVFLPNEEKDDQTPVGFGLIHRYSPNQVYCSLVAISKQFESGYVNVEPFKDKEEMDECEEKEKMRHSLLKINGFHPTLPDLTGLPQYFTAFAEPYARPLLQCIVDQLVADCFGTYNMELLRNLTVDLYDSESGKEEHPDDLWRDFAGFVVADRFRYAEIDIKCESLLSTLSNSLASLPHGINIQPFSKSTRTLFHDYDQSVSVMGRTEYLDFIIDLNGIQGMIAIDEQHQPIGYALVMANRLLQCYADNEQIASALIYHVFESAKSDRVISLFLRMGSDHGMDKRLLPTADRVRRVRRFHSRLVPTTVNWAKVFAPNIGANIY